MTKANDPSCASKDASETPPCQGGDQQSLTDAQLEFAKLLGRFLAQRWSEEQERKQDAAASVKTEIAMPG
jgi:hypothetical protein